MISPGRAQSVSVIHEGEVEPRPENTTRENP
jgi:hypothetical protein